MALFFRALACLVVVAITNAYGASVGNNADIYIANKVIAPDGFERSGVLAGTAAGVDVTGPLIRGFKGNRFRLNVINQLSDSSMLKTTSIHWHGFFQEGSSWADGPAFVTQCPIASGDSFLYDFRVPDQAGTFWYHAHLSTQYCDGLRGAFVVYDLLDPHRLRYLVDNDDTVITLADWVRISGYLHEHVLRVLQYHTVAPQAGLVPVPDSTLINGRGRYAGGPTVPLALIRVLWGIKYRFRLVSLSCDPNYTFSIDGHKMTIIEVDGVNTKPLEVDSIQIFAGQRYSFVLHANQRIANYWIRANPNLGTRGFEGGLNSAILRYYGAPNQDPTTTEGTSTNPLIETNLVPLRNAGAPGVPGVGNADVNINLAMAFDFPSLQFTINGAPWTSPTSPVLLQIISGASSAADLLPPGSVYALPRNKVVELSIPALAVGGPHPIHLHGHVFDVVRSAGSSTYNYRNPVRRDVVSTGTGSDNVTIRFKTDNPGPWFLHCHIDWHLEIGLAVVFAEDTASTARQRPPQSWSDLCPIYDSLTEEQKGGIV
ncbi:multi-copper oxidase superfamily [Pleurotus ostreatus PC15]|uniref:laccase n=1 Tax=Pleurotus ostreatus (strain PC15) TaxID=1137138 RepID=A0A067NPB6_PLEO1|nr:multi-copper oxidase superfamily [Pleurotus ostreatus PC15]